MRDLDNACTLPEAARHAAGVDAGKPDVPTIYWHRELPPLAASAVAEHIVDAVSCRVPGTIAHRDELWTKCYRDLMEHAVARLHQEVERLGGRYAHVLEESIHSRHDDTTGESWLAGRFKYTLLR